MKTSVFHALNFTYILFQLMIVLADVHRGVYTLITIANLVALGNIPRLLESLVRLVRQGNIRPLLEQHQLQFVHHRC